MFKNVAELRDYRNLVKAALAKEKLRIVVCGGAGCVSKGANKVYEKFLSIMKEKNIEFSVVLEKENAKDVRLKKSGCHGFCEMGPLVRIEPTDWLYVKVKEEDCEEIVEKTVLKGECVERLCFTENGKTYVEQKQVPFYKLQTKLSLFNCDKIDATNIDEYLGYNHEITSDIDIPIPKIMDKKPCGRAEMKLRYANQRGSDFLEIEQGLSLEEAMQEASRCLRCDCHGFGSFRGGRNTKW